MQLHRQQSSPSQTRIVPGSRADIGFLVQVVLLASREESERGPWDDLDLPPEKLLHLLGKLCAQPSSPLFHGRFAIAKVSGLPVAAAASLEHGAPTDHPERARALGNPHGAGRRQREWATEIGRWLALEDAQEEEKLLRLLPVSASSWNLAWLATLPEHRRVGHANALIEEILAEGRWLGHSEASAELSSRNTPAIRALCETGFKIVGVDEARTRVSISL